MPFYDVKRKNGRKMKKRGNVGIFIDGKKDWTDRIRETSNKVKSFFVVILSGKKGRVPFIDMA